jgi:hypothetical protein
MMRVWVHCLDAFSLFDCVWLRHCHVGLSLGHLSTWFSSMEYLSGWMSRETFILHGFPAYVSQRQTWSSDSSRVAGKSILLNSDDEDSDGSLSELLRRRLHILYLSSFDTRNLRPIGESFGRSRRSLHFK